MARQPSVCCPPYLTRTNLIHAIKDFWLSQLVSADVADCGWNEALQKVALYEQVW